MEYRVLGSTGLKVSLLSYGVYSVTGMYGDVPRGEALRLLRLARDLGINHFDTADVYGKGLGEEILKEAFNGSLGELVVATKVGYDFYSNPRRPTRRYDEDYIVEASRRSLRRLGVSSVDLLYIHNPPLEVLRRPEVYRTMRRIVRDGLASHVGVALGPETDILAEALEAMDHGEVEVVQMVYNILEQEPGASIARWARERGVGVVVRVPHAGGVLDETVKLGGEPPAFRDHRELRRAGWYSWALRVYYSRVKPLLDQYPGTPGQKAISYIISSVDPDSIVVVAPSEDRLRDYCSPLSFQRLPPTLVEAVRRIYLEEVYSSPEAPLRSIALAVR